MSAGPVDGLRLLLEGFLEGFYVLFDFISQLIFNLESFDEFAIAKLILLLLIFLIVNAILQKNNLISRSERLNRFIALLIAILAIRYIPNNEFIQAMILPYSAMGIAITVFLPLIIFTAFIAQSEFGPFGRRAGWMLYGIVFISLWWFRRDDLGSADLIYWLGIAYIALAMMFDKKLRKYFGMGDIRKYVRSREKRLVRNLKRRLHQLTQDRENGVVSPEEYKTESEAIKKELGELAAK